MKNARMQILLAVSAQIDNTVSAVCYDFKKSKQTPLKIQFNPRDKKIEFFFTKSMDPDYRVVPWFCEKEWQNLKACLVGKKLASAKEIINVWKSRCFKLDAGNIISFDISTYFF